MRIQKGNDTSKSHMSFNFIFILEDPIIKSKFHICNFAIILFATPTRNWILYTNCVVILY